VDKEVRKLLDEIQQVPGIRIKQGSKHVRVFLNDLPVTTLPQSPSDYRWRANAVAELRRAGILTRPQKESKVSDVDLIPVPELRELVRGLPNRAEFARFIVYDLGATHPDLRTYMNYDSAAASLNQLVHGGDRGLRHWAHLLLDRAIRQWQEEQAATNGGSPIITDTELDEAISIDRAIDQAVVDVVDEVMVEIASPPMGAEELPTEIGELSMVELARDHEELTGRINKLSESIRSLTDQYEALAARREQVGTAILSRLAS